MTLRRRTFPEVLDNVLTALVGGVAAEAHPFPPPNGGPPYRHGLQQPPAADVVSLYGSLNGEPHEFRKGIDYELLDDGATIEWQDKDLPDGGTLVDVNYTSRRARAALDDLYAGSVARTLAETTALEIARLYAQLEAVYDAGFVDTATGGALDNVVALLDVERVRAGRAAGELEFTRVDGVRGSLTILAGTRVRTPKGDVEYETTATVTMPDGQSVIRVAARDLEANDPQPAGALSVVVTPIAGIASVANPAPTALAAQDETDAELRARAKAILHGSERATLGALLTALANEGLAADVTEPYENGQATGVPVGTVVLAPHVDSLPPELSQRLQAAVEDVRPLGIRVEITGGSPPARLDLDLRLESQDGLLAEDLRAAQAAVRQGIADYVSRLRTGSDASVNRIVGIALAVPGVTDLHVVSATLTPAGGSPQDVVDRDRGVLALGGSPVVLGQVALADPALPTLLDVNVTYAAGGTPPDRVAIQQAVAAKVAQANDANAHDLAAGEAARTLAYDELAAAAAAPAGATVRFTLSAQSGAATVLSASGDAYALTPYERLSLANVTVAQASA